MAEINGTIKTTVNRKRQLVLTEDEAEDVFIEYMMAKLNLKDKTGITVLFDIASQGFLEEVVITYEIEDVFEEPI